MGLFDFGKQIKATAIVTNLEWALQRSHDSWYLNHHLTSATQALVKLRKARGENLINEEGWAYIAQMAQNLVSKIEFHGDAQLMLDARYIHDFALEQYRVQSGF